jgi:DNA-binding NtrC family response regulator
MPRVRVLVADGGKDVRAMMAVVLRVRPFPVIEAATTAAGLRAFEGASFDGAMVDIFLVDGNGFDLIAVLRGREPDLPAVAVLRIAILDLVSPATGMLYVVSLQKPFRPQRSHRYRRARARQPPRCQCLTQKNAPGAGAFHARLLERAGRQEPFGFTSA